MELSILVDLDGVLADFERRRFDILTSRGQPAVPPSEVFDFYATRSYTERFGSEYAREARRVTTLPGFFEHMEPIPGGIEGVRKLVGMGHDVRICSKPLNEHPNCTEEKRAWIERHLGSWWLERAILTQRKSEYVADALIDDRPDLVHYTRRRGEPEPKWAHVLYVQPWNTESSMHDYSMEDWDDFQWVELLLRTKGQKS